MNKIVLRLGLLIFLFSIIYFTQRGMSVEKVLINSFAIFVFLTAMISLITIGLIKAINSNSLNKLNSLSDHSAGHKENE
ncbi:MAG: hypothetical protein AB1775_01145 [Bacteroidota bacterium]